MADHNASFQRLASEAADGKYTRRQIIAGAIALGLSAAAVSEILANATYAQEATPGASPAASPALPTIVPIVGKEMTPTILRQRSSKRAKSRSGTGPTPQTTS